MSINRDTAAVNSNTRTIIVQDRARITLDATEGSEESNISFVAGVIESQLFKNGEPGIVSMSTTENNSEVVTATLDRGIWQTGNTLDSILGGNKVTLAIWGRVAII